MYVCVCRGVTDDAVEAAVRAGATSLPEVAAATGATVTCGTCHDLVEDVVDLCLQRCGAPCSLAGSRRG